MRLSLIAIALLSHACFVFETSEPAAPDNDAGDTSDATPDAPVPTGACTLTTAQNQHLLGLELLDSAPVTVGRAARLSISHVYCPGDVRGIITTGFSFETRSATITATNWERSGDSLCDLPPLIRRPVTINFPSPGTWTVRASDEELTVEVGAEPATTCEPQGDSCDRDCQCPAGELCLSSKDAESPAARCATPCEFGRECTPNTCGTTDDGFPNVCLREYDECSYGLPAATAVFNDTCPMGFDCVGEFRNGSPSEREGTVYGACEVGFELNQVTRGDCYCDSDCDLGLRCVEKVGFVTTKRPCIATDGSTCFVPPAGTCEAICRTTSDNWCSFMHTCSPQGAGAGVCEWLGE